MNILSISYKNRLPIILARNLFARRSNGPNCIRRQLPEKSIFFTYGRGMSTTAPPLPPPPPPKQKQPKTFWAKFFMGSFSLSFLSFSLKQKLHELEDEVELALDVAETVVDVVQAVATTTERVSSEVGDELETGKLKDVLDYAEDFSKEIVENMDMAKVEIEKVDDIREEVETLLNQD
ncbi:hypothetical protein ZOSMA_23G01230 [Zostera marina]|uniref:Uncharacterized protein n=1 Tax=Zostera marina TaxID=29655 RepID=A0A0K9PHL4_ZOSMR|nr:hypothetical protein ZOSMA_23G01230 [Zostera marina]